MEEIKANRWYVIGNKLSISLMKYHVEIKYQEKSKYKIKIVNNGMKETLLYFNALEEAISFTQNIISKNYELEEIIENYQDIYQRKKEKNKKLKKKTKPLNTSIKVKN